MKASFWEYLSWWGPYAVGLLAMVYALVQRRSVGEDAELQEDGKGWKLPPALIGAALLIAFVLIGALSGPRELSWGFAAAFLIGGAASLAALAFSEWRGGQAGLLFGIGLSLLEIAFVRNYFREAPMTYVLTTGAGVWFAAAVICYGGLGRDLGSVRATALGAAVLVASVALGIYHYTGSAIGSLFAVDAAAIAVLLAMFAMLIAALGPGIARVGAALVFLGLLWWLSRLLSELIVNDSSAGLSCLIGAAAVLLVEIAAAASRSQNGGPGLLGSAEARVLSVLVAVAAFAASMRWLSGYGVALASAGGLAALPLARSLLRDDAEQADYRAGAGLGAAVVVGLASVAYVRVFLEATSGSGAMIDIFQAYTLPGIVLGACLAAMLASLQSDWPPERSVNAVIRTTRGLGAIALLLAIVLAISYVWRLDAANGLMIGLAAGVFYAMASATTLQVEANALLTPGLLVVIVTLIPVFLSKTANLTRAAKIHVMLWVLGVTVMVVILSAAARLIRARRVAA